MGQRRDWKAKGAAFKSETIPLELGDPEQMPQPECWVRLQKFLVLGSALMRLGSDHSVLEENSLSSFPPFWSVDHHVAPPICILAQGMLNKRPTQLRGSGVSLAGFMYWFSYLLYDLGQVTPPL